MVRPDFVGSLHHLQGGGKCVRRLSEPITDSKESAQKLRFRRVDFESAQISFPCLLIPIGEQLKQNAEVTPRVGELWIQLDGTPIGLLRLTVALQMILQQVAEIIQGVGKLWIQLDCA